MTRSTDHPESSTPSDIDRVDALNVSAWKLRVSDSVEAHSRSLEAVDLARRLDYRRGLAEGLRTLGFTWIRFGKHAQARDALDEAARLFTDLDDPEGLAYVYTYLGIVERGRSNYAASIDYLLRSIHSREGSEDAEGMALSLYHTGVTYRYAGDFGQALDYLLRSLELSRDAEMPVPESSALKLIGDIHFEGGDWDAAVDHYQQSLSIRREIGDEWGVAGCLDGIGSVYCQLGRYAEARDQCERALEIAHEVGDRKGKGNALFNLSRIALGEERYPEALDRAAESLRVREEIGDRKAQGEVLLLLGEAYGNPGFPDQSIERALDYLQRALEIDRDTGATDLAYRVHLALSRTLKAAGRYEDALMHLDEYHTIEKQVLSETVNQRILTLKMEHQVDSAKKESELFRLKNVELAQLVEEVSAQQEEIQSKNAELEETLDRLRSTQAQLVHQEKMASLGALTAGIAHEIKNPLNFIINFAEVSRELVRELADVTAPEEIAAIRDDLVHNATAIEEHGHRADAIVQAMMAHAHGSSQERVDVDVNRTVDEHVDLAWNAYRETNQTIQVQIDRHFSPDTGTVEAAPQQIGRVILNLLSNAFDAVSDRAATADGPYTARVDVSTRRVGGDVEIRVADNGSGIPTEIRNRIFEPFFTTKPTGQRTGLGLSLSHDIVVQGHGGSIAVECQDGERTELVVSLPAH